MGTLPVVGHEVIDADSRELELVVLGARIREGLTLDSFARDSERDLVPPGRAPERLVPVVAEIVEEGYLDGTAVLRGRAVLTLRGRLMVDYVTGRLLG